MHINPPLDAPKLDQLAAKIKIRLTELFLKSRGVWPELLKNYEVTL